MDEFDGGFLQSSQKMEHTGTKTLRCLTSKQIGGIVADDGPHLVDRNEVTNVQACGYVTLVKEMATGCMFELNDTTGPLECVFWTSGAFEDGIVEKIVQNALLRVTGSLKIFAGKKTVHVSTATVVNANMLVYHLTSCLYQHLFFTGRLEKREEKRPSIGLSRIQNEILEVYRKNQDEEGLDVEVVVAMLRDRYGETDIRNNVEGLLNDCHLHSVDGNSYRTTM